MIVPEIDTLVFEMILIATGIIATFIISNMLNKRKLKQDQHDIRDERLDKLERSVWRLNKTLLIFAKIIDTQTEKAHDVQVELEEIAEELLGNGKRTAV